MYPDEEEVQSAMQVFLQRSLGKLQGIDSSWLTTAGQLLQKTAPKWLTRQVERYVSSCTTVDVSLTCCNLPVLQLLFSGLCHNRICGTEPQTGGLQVCHSLLQDICSKHVAATAEA